MFFLRCPVCFIAIAMASDRHPRLPWMAQGMAQEMAQEMA